jgi:hypothetical protein
MTRAPITPPIANAVIASVVVAVILGGAVLMFNH